MYNGTRQEQTSLLTEKQVEAVLQASGVDIYGEIESHYILYCPFHSNTRTPAAEVDKETGQFFCFGCQETHPFIELVMQLTGKTYFQAARIIDTYKESQSISAIIERAQNKKPDFEPFDEGMIKRLHDNCLESERALTYLQGEKRRLTTESIKQFMIGYSPKMDMVTLPAHSPDGKMYIGFMGRSVEGYGFKNTKFTRAKSLFNLHRVRKFAKVHVVESAFDAVRLHQLGIPAVATYGAYVSKGQMELLTKNFNSVIILADNDPDKELNGKIINGGKIFTTKIKEQVGDRARIVPVPSEYKDIGDMQDADILNLIARADNPLNKLLGD